MRIAIASIVFPYPRRGVFPGVERLLEGHTRALVDLGHEVEVLTTFWNGGTTEDLWQGVPVRRFPDFGNALGPAGRVLDLHYLTWGRRVTNWLLKERAKFDVVHAVSPLYGIARLQAAGLPVVSSFFHYDHYRQLRQVLYLHAHHALERSAYRASDLVVPIWDHGGREVAQRFGVPLEKIRVARQGITLPPDGASIARVENRLLYVGNLEPRKGLGVLLDSMVGLPDDTHLDVVGKGPDEARMREHATRLGLADRVHFRGFVDEPTLDELYRASTLFVFPSLQVTGFVLWEAMARGCPVVATDAGGTPEIVGNGAMLVPPADAVALRAAVGGLLKDPQGRADLVVRGFAVAHEASWERVARRMETIYEEAIMLRRGPHGTC